VLWGFLERKVFMRRIINSVLAMACVGTVAGAAMAAAPAAAPAGGATAAGGAAATPAGEQVENPIYKAWASHKPGTTVVTKMTVNFAGNPNESTVTQKLVSVAPDKVVVERTTEGGFGGGGGQPIQQEIPAKIAKSQEGVLPAGFGRGGRGARGGAGAAATPPAPTDMKTGTDKVTIAGKTYEATTREYGMTMPGRGGGEGTKTQVKAWYSNDVPGGLLKSETKGTGAQGEFSTKQELVKFEEGTGAATPAQ
jgi:hypothetical protein